MAIVGCARKMVTDDGFTGRAKFRKARKIGLYTPTKMTTINSSLLVVRNLVCIAINTIVANNKSRKSRTLRRRVQCKSQTGSTFALMEENKWICNRNFRDKSPQSLNGRGITNKFIANCLEGAKPSSSSLSALP